MDIRGLGYIGIDVAHVDSWREYAELLGTMVVPDENGFRMRIDERPFRVVVRATEGSRGWPSSGGSCPMRLRWKSPPLSSTRPGLPLRWRRRPSVPTVGCEG
jgi:hypothetical protein